MFENYGYQVIDLGKDVPPEKIAETAVQNKVSVVAFRADDDNSRCYGRKPLKRCAWQAILKIIVGGAVLTQDYADSIGADCYAPMPSAR